jgi:hypothetical protein
MGHIVTLWIFAPKLGHAVCSTDFSQENVQSRTQTLTAIEPGSHDAPKPGLALDCNPPDLCLLSS